MGQSVLAQRVTSPLAVVRKKVKTCHLMSARDEDHDQTGEPGQGPR
jgi:hypothetical protein